LEQTVTRPSLAPFFDPRSVAVIGTSRDPSKVGGSVLANLRSAGFPGRVIPVNASGDTVQGLKAYPSLLAAEGEVDLAVITVPAAGVLPALKECASKGVRGAVVISAGFRESTDEGRQREAELRQPFPEPAVETLAAMAQLAERRVARSEAIPHTVPSNNVRAHVARLERERAAKLGLLELQPLLEAYGIPCAAGQAAATPEEAAVVAQRLGFPVALKVLSSEITHKTDVGGVILGLTSAAEVAHSAGSMLSRVRAARPQAAIREVLVQSMITSGRELLLGMVRVSQFGPLIMVGFGGIYVEVLKDTAVRLAPVPRAEALAMLDELRMAPLLLGVRGEPPVDRSAVAETICRFAQLTIDVPELREIELNPLVAGPTGVGAVHARGTLDR
jgi:acetyltransferase